MNEQLRRLLSAMDDDDDDLRPIDEAVVDELRRLYARYQASNPFKPGDLVTPLPGGTVKGAGEPLRQAGALPAARGWVGQAVGSMADGRYDD